MTEFDEDTKALECNNKLILGLIADKKELNDLRFKSRTRIRLNYAIRRNLTISIGTCLDYLEIPKDLSMKERLAYYKLLNENYVYDRDV